MKSIESGSAKVPNHPVLQQINRHRALVDCQVGHQESNFTFGVPAEIISKKLIYYPGKNSLILQLLLNLIDSKRLFFIDQPFKTMDDVEEYSKDSFSSINVLLLKALANSESTDSNSISGKWGQS